MSSDNLFFWQKTPSLISFERSLEVGVILIFMDVVYVLKFAYNHTKEGIN